MLGARGVEHLLVEIYLPRTARPGPGRNRSEADPSDSAPEVGTSSRSSVGSEFQETALRSTSPLTEHEEPERCGLQTSLGRGLTRSPAFAGHESRRKDGHRPRCICMRTMHSEASLAPGRHRRIQVKVVGKTVEQD